MGKNIKKTKTECNLPQLNQVPPPTFPPNGIFKMRCQKYQRRNREALNYISSTRNSVNSLTGDRSQMEPILIM